MVSFWTQIFFLAAIAGVGIISWTIYKIFYKIFDLQDNPHKREKQSRHDKKKDDTVSKKADEINPSETPVKAEKENKPVSVKPVSHDGNCFTPPSPPAFSPVKIKKQVSSAEAEKVSIPVQKETAMAVEGSFIPPSAPASQNSQSNSVKTPPAREESSAGTEKAEEERVFTPPSAPRRK